MIDRSELRIVCAGDRAAPRRVRHAIEAFLDLFFSEREFVEDVLMAVGEILANAVEHGSDAGVTNTLEVVTHTASDGSLAVKIWDGGTFIERARLKDRGFGLRIARSIARSVRIETGAGTRVEMIFEPPR